MPKTDGGWINRRDTGEDDQMDSQVHYVEAPFTRGQASSKSPKTTQCSLNGFFNVTHNVYHDELTNTRCDLSSQWLV